MTNHPSETPPATNTLKQTPHSKPILRWIPLAGKTLLSINRSNGTHWRTYRKNADEWKHAANHDIH